MERVDGKQDPLDRLGGYRVLRRIATGGTSDVLLAKAEGPLGFERQVVLKLLLSQYRDDEQFARMFAREAAAYARLSHPSIVRLFDFFSQNDQLVMVLEFVDGLPLNRLRASLKDVGKKLSDMSALYVADRIFDALACAHGFIDETGAKSPVIHRDVNPSNVLVGWNSEVKLADFGIARVTGVRSDTQAGLIKGTFGYMAPEQVNGGDIGPHTDVYAAGVLLWEMLAHRKAIQRGALPEIEILRAMAEPQIVSLDVLRPDLDRRLRDAVRFALEPDPAKRKITAEEVCRTLRDISSPAAGRGELHELLKLAKERDKVKKKLLSTSPRESEPEISASTRKIPTLAPKASGSSAPSAPPRKGIELVPSLLKPPAADADATSENREIDKLFDGLALPEDTSPLTAAVSNGPSTQSDRTAQEVDAILRSSSSRVFSEPPRPTPPKAATAQPLAKTLAAKGLRPESDSRATVTVPPLHSEGKPESQKAPPRPSPQLPATKTAPLAATALLGPAGSGQQRGGPTPILAGSPALPPGAGAIPAAPGVPLASELASTIASGWPEPNDGQAGHADGTVARASSSSDLIPIPSATTTLMMGSDRPPVPEGETVRIPPLSASTSTPTPPPIRPVPTAPSGPMAPSGRSSAPPVAPSVPPVRSEPPIAPPLAAPPFGDTYPTPPAAKRSPLPKIALLLVVALLSAGGGVAYVKRGRILAVFGAGAVPSASVAPSSAEPTLPLAWGSTEAGAPAELVDASPEDASLVPLASSTASASASTPSMPDAGVVEAGLGDAGKDAEKPEAPKSTTGPSAHAGTTLLSTANASPSHRIFFDGRVVGETPTTVEVPCGKHTVQLGSAGTTRTLDLPCGQELVIGDR
jgi:eukaryotic-like serine/threonine-protein kinase